MTSSVRSVVATSWDSGGEEVKMTLMERDTKYRFSDSDDLVDISG